MSHENDELIASFAEESNETLADLENDFLMIEENGPDVDTELVNKVFRGIHSMKGSAGFLGLTSIGTLAHEMENVLNLIRSNELIPTPQIVDALLKGGDLLRNMVADVHNSNNVSVAAQIANLKTAVAGGATEELEAVLDREVDITLPDGRLVFMMINEGDLVLRQKQGAHIYVAEVDFITHVHDKGQTPIDFLKRVYKHGEIIDSYMSTAGVRDLSNELPDSLTFMTLLSSKSPLDELARNLELPSECFHLIATADQKNWSDKVPQNSAPASSPTPAQNIATPKTVAPAPVQQQSPAPAQSKKSEPAAPTAPASTEQTSLRVNVKVLDTLMNLAGELVLGRNQLLQTLVTKDHRGLDAVAAQVDQITSELQEAIMQTRMQPIGSVFSKFPRLIRDLSGKLNKQCELLIEGKDVEMDKTIIESISDPLTHLVRNSIDHGIEMPDVRAAAKKDPIGRIWLKAYHQAGKVNISIRDDGGGINIERIKEKAVSKGILSPNQADEISDRDATRLIFHPGFSTAEQVTDVSGRGVGMDVVRTNIERMGGTVDVETELGKGTTIYVKLPLTLAIIPSLVVRCGDNRFALPQVNISELVRIKASDVAQRIERVKNAEVLRLRGNLLPLVRLAKVLHTQSKYHDRQTEELVVNHRENLCDRRKNEELIIEESRAGSERRENTIAGALNIIVVETGNLRYGLVVDELFDSKEIVVKPLGRHMKDSPCLAGATILGDGKVALILDVAGIASHTQLIIPESDSNEKYSSENAGSAETQSSLIFSNAPTEYFGIPTAFISRIERIKTEQIDSVGGQHVLQYRGASLPLLKLEDHIKAQCAPELRALYIVVFKISGKEVGMIAPNLEDITEISVNIDTETFREPGIIGSLIHNEKTVRLIDVFELAETVYPEWAEERSKVHARSGNGSETTEAAVIMLAEDSAFFRNQVANFLEADGYKVVACEDGKIAWDALQNPELKIDLVVTDIEMPNMDGLELTKYIKGDVCFAHIPVIAVTSLASEEDLRRGQQAGVDDYHVKMDREELLASIARQLKQSREKAGSSINKEQFQTGGQR